MTTTIVLSGTSSTDALLNAGDTLIVSSGGTSISTTIDQGGTEVVSSGGTALSTMVAAGGTLILLSGGVGSGTVVADGGTELVSGGTAFSTDVSSGGSEVVFSGGKTSGTTVESGGTATAQSGGVLVGATVWTGGLDYISSGATEQGSILSGGSETVYSGGTAIDAESFGRLNVLGGGVAISATVSSGYIFVRGLAVDTVLDDGGVDYVYSAGLASNSIINDGGIQYDFGAAIDTVVNSGGYEFVSASVASKSYALGTTIESGGSEIVMSGGTGQGTRIEGGTLALTAGAVTAGGITFIGAGGTVLVDVASSDVATISGFGPADAIELENVAYVEGGSANLDSGNVLTVTEGSTAYTLQFAPDESFAGEFFQLLSENQGTATTIIVTGTPCYVRGTRILTEHGEVAVEDLAIGDRLVTIAGERRPLRWIGQRRYGRRSTFGNQTVLPLCIRAGALSDNVPTRDLWVSPLHAMYLDGVLVPAAALINGVSIVQAEEVEEVSYYHLELETHDVILAEGAASETFVDDESRAMFHNCDEYLRLYPEAIARPAQYCAPRIEGGPVLETIRQRLQARARPTKLAAAPRPLLGHLDAVTRAEIRGWARERNAYGNPVLLRIRDNGAVIGETMAEIYRPDLEREGIGEGRHGFVLQVPGGLCPDMAHCIQVERASDGQVLPGSPFVFNENSRSSLA